MEPRDDVDALVGVFIRPLQSVDYTDPQQLSAKIFDVILMAGAAASKSAALYVPRSLRDFAQLQRELERELKDDSADHHRGSSSRLLTSPLAITPTISAYLAAHGDDESTAAATAAEIFNRSTETEFEERFAWQLEHFLTALVNHADGKVRDSLALKKFLRGGSEPLSLEDRDVIDRWFVDSEQSDGAAVHERIPSGSLVEHSVQVQVGEDGGKSEESIQQSAHQALVLWRFASQGEHVMFSARFTEQGPADDDGGDSAADCDPYAADPYSLSAKEEADDEDDAIMAHYCTYYSFPATTGDDNPSCPAYEYGYFVASMSGDLELEWENADSTSIHSKPLTFQVRVLSLTDAAGEQSPGNGEEMNKLARKLSESQRRLSASEHDEGAFWLQKLIMKSKITMSLRRILGLSIDYDDVYFAAGLSLDTPHDNGGGNDGDDRGRDTEMLKRVQEEKHFHEQRAREFEERMAQLEDALRATKSDLKKANDTITISEEIYKASLETITQLEVAASVSRLPASVNVPPSLEIPSLLPPPASSTLAFQEDRGIATKPKDGVPEKEHQRVVNLCTTFQEQCLWRSIELAESEKRNMVLEAKLQDSEQEKFELQAHTTSLEELVATLQAEVKKLKTHKSILVQEVKKLQPYSQINLAALVQEAQEARMMQRSLQAQLDSRDVVGSVATSTTATTLAIAAEEDGTGGGFVVVESDDHNSFYRQ